MIYWLYLRLVVLQHYKLSRYMMVKPYISNTHTYINVYFVDAYCMHTSILV